MWLFFNDLDSKISVSAVQLKFICSSPGYQHLGVIRYQDYVEVFVFAPIFERALLAHYEKRS